MNVRDRRNEIRMLCADMAEVCWTDSSGREHQEIALLEDISASGACLQFETEIPVGVPIRLKCGSEAIPGTVCYCTYREIGYFAGVEFDENAKWSRTWFEPQHLVDLEQIVRRAKGKVH